MIDGDGWAIGTILADCLCEELATAEGPDLCFCGVIPGALIADEYGENGMAWVRLNTAYPSDVLPVATTQATCSTPIAYQFEVGVLRCTVMPDDYGRTTPQQQVDAYRLQMSDMRAARRAVCCLPDEYDYFLGAYTPVGPSGGLVGGSWLVTVQKGI